MAAESLGCYGSRVTLVRVTTTSEPGPQDARASDDSRTPSEADGHADGHADVDAHGTHREDHQGSHEGSRPRRGAWRGATAIAGLIGGLLITMAAVDSQGTDLRPGRYTDLASLVANEKDSYDDLEAERAALQAQAAELTDAVGHRGVSRLRDELDTLRDPAGMVAREGPGVTVVLSDSDEAAFDKAIDRADENTDLNEYVVHQQQIQSVVNAMWRAGATAVTVEGQRIISTTGIRCEGPAVQLKGRPYAQPYEIQAVGVPDEIVSSILRDPLVIDFISKSLDPDIEVGWEMHEDENVSAPAFEGPLGITYAKPLRTN